jgi:MFS family permease
MAGGNKWLNYSGAFLYGFALPMTTMFLPLIIREIFGGRDYGELYGYVTMIIVLSAAFGTAGIGFIYDLSGSYRPAFLLGFVMILVTALFLNIAYRSGKKLWDIRDSETSLEEILSKHRDIDSRDPL